MIDQALVYNSAYAAYSSANDRLGAVIEGLRLTLPSGLALTAFTGWLYGLVSRRWSSPLVPITLVAFPLELLLATFGRGYHYYFIAWLPSMATVAWFRPVTETLIAAPGSPTLASPANGATGVSVGPTLIWNGVITATSYHFQLSLDSSFTSVVGETSLVDTSFLAGPLQHTTQYYWRVRATNAGGTSPYSIPRHFTTIIATPASPALDSRRREWPGMHGPR